MHKIPEIAFFHSIEWDEIRGSHHDEAENRLRRSKDRLYKDCMRRRFKELLKVLFISGIIQIVCFVSFPCLDRGTLPDQFLHLERWAQIHPMDLMGHIGAIF